MREIAARICRDYLTGAWKTISASDLQLKRIRYRSTFNLRSKPYINLIPNYSGGLSNFLYYVSLPDDIDTCNNVKSVKRARKDTSLQEPKEVLLRIYGRTHGEQALEAVLTDTVVFTLLSERKLGPKLHGIFPGGRIEQYIPVSYSIFYSNTLESLWSMCVCVCVCMCYIYYKHAMVNFFSKSLP